MLPDRDPRWGPASIPDPEKLPDWIKPYQAFIKKYLPKLRLRIRWQREMPRGFPGDSEGVTTWPWVIWLTLRVRWLMFQDVPAFRRDGVWIFFRQIAFCEFWQADPFLWPLRWLKDKKGWCEKAGKRADQLLQLWEWKVNEDDRTRSRRHPPL